MLLYISIIFISMIPNTIKISDSTKPKIPDLSSLLSLILFYLPFTTFHLYYIFSCFSSLLNRITPSHLLPLLHPPILSTRFHLFLTPSYRVTWQDKDIDLISRNRCSKLLLEITRKSLRQHPLPHTSTLLKKMLKLPILELLEFV